MQDIKTVSSGYGFGHPEQTGRHIQTPSDPVYMVSSAELYPSEPKRHQLEIDGRDVVQP